MFADDSVSPADDRAGSQRLAPESCLDIARYLLTSLVENPAASPADTFRDMRLVETLVAEVLGGPTGDGTGEQLLADFQALLREKEICFVERKAADHRDALAMKDEYISQQDRLIVSQQATMEKGADALRQKDDYIAQQQTALEGLVDALHQKDDYIAQQLAALEGLVDALHQKDDFIAQQQTALNGQAETLGKLQGRVAEMNSYLSALRRGVAWRVLSTVLRLPPMPDKEER